MQIYVAFGHVPPDKDNPYEKILPTPPFTEAWVIDLQSLALANMSGSEEDRGRVDRITIYELPAEPFKEIVISPTTEK